MKRLICALLAAALLCGLLPAFAEEPEGGWTFEYSARGKNLYRLGNTGYLVEGWREFLIPEYLDTVRKNAAQLNEYVPLGGGVKKYVYFIESPRSVNLDSDLSGENEVFTLIKEQYEADGIGTLALDKGEDFLNWFYKTDQHWNYKGSYQGYCDIVRMIFGEDEPLMVPAETVVFEEAPFNGAFNAKLGYSQSDELFTVYRFDGMRDYTVFINGGPEKSYGKAEKYFKGKYPRITVYNHYGAFYGGDAGELIIDTDQPEKSNLLLISNSYSNAITLLLAQHFNRIYSVDPRYYKLRMNSDFHIQKYLKKNQIDTVLCMGDFRYFMQPFSIK